MTYSFPLAGEEHCIVRYDGPGLVDGAMRVQDLAPALAALADLYRESNRELHPEEPDVVVSVEAVAPGSIAIHLVISHEDVTDAVKLFSGPTATAIANLITFISTPVGLLAYLIRRRRSGAVVESRPTREGFVLITFEDGTTAEVPRDVLLLAESPSVRQQAKKAVRPLALPDVDLIAFEQPNVGETVVVTERDLLAFDYAPPTIDELLVNEDTVILTLRTVALDGKKWRVLRLRSHLLRRDGRSGVPGTNR